MARRTCSCVCDSDDVVDRTNEREYVARKRNSRVNRQNDMKLFAKPAVERNLDESGSSCDCVRLVDQNAPAYFDKLPQCRNGVPLVCRNRYRAWPGRLNCFCEIIKKRWKEGSTICKCRKTSNSHESRYNYTDSREEAQLFSSRQGSSAPNKNNYYMDDENESQLAFSRKGRSAPKNNCSCTNNQKQNSSSSSKKSESFRQKNNSSTDIQKQNKSASSKKGGEARQRNNYYSDDEEENQSVSSGKGTSGAPRKNYCGLYNQNCYMNYQEERQSYSSGKGSKSASSKNNSNKDENKSASSRQDYSASKKRQCACVDCAFLDKSYREEETDCDSPPQTTKSPPRKVSPHESNYDFPLLASDPKVNRYPSVSVHELPTLTPLARNNICENLKRELLQSLIKHCDKPNELPVTTDTSKPRRANPTNGFDGHNSSCSCCECRLRFGNQKSRDQ